MTYQEAQDRRKAMSAMERWQLWKACQQRGSHQLTLTQTNTPQRICRDCLTTFTGDVAVDPPNEPTANSEA